MLTLTTIVKEVVDDTFMYSESISTVKLDDVLDADIVFIGIFTFSAIREYELTRFIKNNSNVIVVMGGLHASMNYPEAVNYCDYVLLDEGDESILEFIDSIQKEAPINFLGIAYQRNNKLIFTGNRKPPENINIIPNRYLLYRYNKMAWHNTLWPQEDAPITAITVQ